MKRIFLGAVALSVLFAGCSSQDSSVKIQADAYRVSDQTALNAKLDHFNQQLETSFANFKKTHYSAFSTQNAVSVKNLNQLHMHAVSATALKTTKQAYCEMMNGYFADIYRLGYFNSTLLGHVNILNVDLEHAQSTFSSANAYYNFVMEQATTYRQAQQIMNFGCNLKSSLMIE